MGQQVDLVEGLPSSHLLLQAGDGVGVAEDLGRDGESVDDVLSGGPEAGVAPDVGPVDATAAPLARPTSARASAATLRLPF